MQYFANSYKSMMSHFAKALKTREFAKVSNPRNFYLKSIVQNQFWCVQFKLHFVFFSPMDVEDLSRNMLGHRLTTKQTPPEGVLVEKVMVCKGLNITRETYLAILMDREYNGPVIVASPEGGVDIEEVAERSPEKLMKVCQLKCRWFGEDTTLSLILPCHFGIKFALWMEVKSKDF